MAGEAGRLIASAAALAIGAVALVAAMPIDPVKALAGRYGAHFRNGDIDGNTGWSDDVVEVVPVDARHAYVRFDLKFFNGHSCSLSGVAEAQGGALVYRDHSDTGSGGMQCTLRIVRKGSKLTWNDADGGCQSYCGSRGGFAGGEIPWSSRRSITYMARLKASSEYREAVQEWRKGN
jgi:hypothetical protein